MRLINWMVSNFSDRKSQNQQIYLNNNNSGKFLHSSLFLIAQQQHGVINEHPIISSKLMKQKHPWETTKRFIRFPLNLMSNKKRLRKFSNTSSSSSSFSEEVWLKMRTNNDQNNIENKKSPQQRFIENRRFTESPKALRRSFRRVCQRGGSVHFSKIKSAENGIFRPNSLNLKFNQNYEGNKEEINYLTKKQENNEKINNNNYEEVFKESKIERNKSLFYSNNEINENKKIISFEGIDLEKIKNEEEIEKLKENFCKKEENNTKINKNNFVEKIIEKNQNLIKENEKESKNEILKENQQQINVTDFAFQLQQKMAKVLRHQYGSGRKLKVLFVDSPDIYSLGKEKLKKDKTFNNQQEKYRRKWSSEIIKPSKNPRFRRLLISSSWRIKKEENIKKTINSSSTNNSTILNQKRFFERKYFDLTKRNSNTSTGSGNYGINNSLQFNLRTEIQKRWFTTKKEEIQQNENNYFRKFGRVEFNENKRLNKRFWSLRNKKRKYSNISFDCGEKLSNSCEIVGNRLALLEEGCEQDHVWMIKRVERKQKEIEKIVKLTGEWVQVQILNLSNDPEGLGFGIVGGHSTGVVVKSIIAGSVADKDQRLRPGDRILQIGHISTQGLNSQQIAALLRQQDGPYVQMTVAHSIQIQDTETTDTPMCWTMTTRAALSASTLDEEVQRRLDLFANKPSTSKCNGINHTKTILNTPTILNEGTEFPDQLTNRLGPETVLKDLNKPNTSSTNIIAEDGGSVDSKTKKTAEKLLDS
ncbi:hypothetical protein ACQ4LE_003953, partial [Meloidogyne hapla]